MRLKLSLFENAIDSLNEALKKYEEGEDGDKNAYKFCVQHLSHFLELLLKYQVTKTHHLLIYKNPFKKITQDSLVIGMRDAIQFLENDSKKISSDFKRDLGWLKSLRNKIEHYEFEMQVQDVTDTIGRLIRSALLFGQEHKIELGNNIDRQFLNLADVYKGRLAIAHKRVEELEVEAYRGIRLKESKDFMFGPYRCSYCGHKTLVPKKGSPTRYRCEFCREEEGDGMLVNCDCCGSTSEYVDMEFWDMDSGAVEIRCPMCTGAYQMSKDD